MIAVVEVDLCFQRPPVIHRRRRVIASGVSEIECELAAIAIAEVTAQPQRIKPVMAVGSRVVDLLEV